MNTIVRKYKVQMTYPNGDKTHYVDPMPLGEALRKAKRMLWGGKRSVSITPVLIERNRKERIKS